MNEFSRRYICPECGFKGKASRKRVNEANGIMTCAVCRAWFPSDPLFRGSVGDEERDRKRNESKSPPVENLNRLARLVSGTNKGEVR